MTRSEAIKAFFIKSVLPVAAAMLLYCIFKSACMKGGMIGGFVLAWRMIAAAWYLPFSYLQINHRIKYRK